MSTAQGPEAMAALSGPDFRQVPFKPQTRCGTQVNLETLTRLQTPDGPLVGREPLQTAFHLGTASGSHPLI